MIRDMSVVQVSTEVRSIIFSRLIKAMSLDLQGEAETKYSLRDRMALIYQILVSIEFYQSTFWLLYLPALLEIVVVGNAFLKYNPQSLIISFVSSVWFVWVLLEIAQGYAAKIHNAVLEEIGTHMLENLHDC